MSLLLTLNRFHQLFWCLHCWLWTSKCQLGKYNVENYNLFFQSLTLLWRNTHHIETNALICSANQWTGFYMIGTSVMKELIARCAQCPQNKFNGNFSVLRMINKTRFLPCVKNDLLNWTHSDFKICWTFFLLPSSNFHPSPVLTNNSVYFGIKNVGILLNNICVKWKYVSTLQRRVVFRTLSNT